MSQKVFYDQKRHPSRTYKVSLCIRQKVSLSIRHNFCGFILFVTWKSSMVFHSSMARKPKGREKSCVAAPLRVVLI